MGWRALNPARFGQGLVPPLVPVGSGLFINDNVDAENQARASRVTDVAAARA